MRHPVARPARLNCTPETERLKKQMKSTLLFRLVLLLVAAITLVGLIWLVGRGPRKDMAYYFPGWVGPSVTAADLNARFRELTNSPGCVGMMFDGSQAKPTKAGLLWSRIVEELPAGFARHLPQYVFPDSDQAILWLFGHAEDAAVATELERAWPEMKDGARAIWFRWISRPAMRSQPAYARLALATPESADLETRVAAARLLVSADAFGDAEASFVARVFVSGGTAFRAPNFQANHLIGDLVRFGRAHPTIVAALANLATNKHSLSGPAALAVAALEPSELSHRSPLISFLERLRRSQSGANDYVADMLTWPEFRSVWISEWGLGLLAEQLVVSRKTNQIGGTDKIVTTGLDELWLRVMDSLGTNVAPLSGRLIALIQREPDVSKARLAVTFANVAPHTPENVTAAIPLLSDHETVAPMLLWLGGAGSGADLATSAVRAIADDSRTYPPEAGNREVAFQLDPVLARRYALVPARPKETRGPELSKSVKRPSDIWITEKFCPIRWVDHWPRTRRIASNAYPEWSAQARAQLRRSARNQVQLEGTTLRQLAQDCLRRISVGSASGSPEWDGAKERADDARGDHQ